MGTGMGSGRISDEMIARAAASRAPITLPVQAFGPGDVEWFDPPRPVWAWLSWRDRPAERIPCVATGANDRVVVLDVDSPGGRWQPVVWRNAVSVRRPDRR